MLIIAWLNYINLNTARSLDRRQEVGIRKTIGARRSQLIWQFLLESAMLNLLALLISLLLVDLAYPYFEQLTGQSQPADDRYSGWFWQSLLSLFVLGTIASGGYPAWHLSRFSPSRALQGEQRSQPREPSRVRQLLVVVQFVLSMVLVSGAFGMYRQMQFVAARHAQLNTDHKLAVQAPQLADSSSTERWPVFLSELRQQPGVKAIAQTSSLPGLGYNYGNNAVRLLEREGQTPADIWYGDHQFITIYGIELLAGRNFDPLQDRREAVVIINEAAARNLVGPDIEALLGQRVDVEGAKRIIGICQNYHHNDLHSPFSPSVYIFQQNRIGWLTLEVHPGQRQAVMIAIEAKFREWFPDHPYRSFYFDALYEALYLADRRFGLTVATFSGLAILVACLGLVGLTLFNTRRRAKEIGIRKVLGASSWSLLQLLNRELLLMVGIATILGIPAAWWAFSLWLEQFAFHIPLGPGLFLVPGAALLLLASLSASWHTWQLAQADPVSSLRTE